MAAMKFWRRARKAQEAPTGVRIVAPDGREFPCDVLRDPDGDEDGCAMWVAVPREELPLAGPGWVVAADMLPGHSILSVRIWAVEVSDS
jgi:hypothetical protein